MRRAERYRLVIERFEEHVPEVATELHYSSPFGLLVAVILSAQCTDKRVNMVTPALLEAYPTPEAMAAAEAEDIFPYIKSISYPNNKSKALVGMARGLVKDFGGQVPDTMGQLTLLPGVGRKTANVMLSVVYDVPAMAVDTHVFRVAERLGLTTGSRTPLATEQTLTANIPENLLGKAHHWLILHGRYVCKAQKPLCQDCFLADVCRCRERQLKKEARAALKARSLTKDINDGRK